jgi:hypothetical protein
MAQWPKHGSHPWIDDHSPQSHPLTRNLLPSGYDIHSLPWKDSPFVIGKPSINGLIGKPSISMGKPSISIGKPSIFRPSIPWLC